MDSTLDETVERAQEDVKKLLVEVQALVDDAHAPIAAGWRRRPGPPQPRCNRD